MLSAARATGSIEARTSKGGVLDGVLDLVADFICRRSIQALIKIPVCRVIRRLTPYCVTPELEVARRSGSR